MNDRADFPTNSTDGAGAAGAGQASAAAATSVASKTLLPWILGGAAVVLVGGGATFALTSQDGPDAAAPVTSVSASPSPTPSPSREAVPEPEPEPVATAVALPTDCESLYSPAFYAKLMGYGPVPPEANMGPRAVPFSNTEVPQVVESTVATAPHIECLWGFENEYSIGIQTVLAEVTDAQVAEITQALPAAGFAAIPELGSVRYVKEMEYAAGYSIIARDGILIATRWVDWPEAGYTADIVNTVLGPAE